MSNIVIKNVTKSYQGKEVVSNISLNIEEGKIYGLLGRNGAGKTTLLHLITNRAILDSGKILIDGEDIYENDKALSKIYFMEEKNFFPESMKIVDVFKWTKEFYEDFDMEYAIKLSELFKLNIKKKVKNLSTGYKSISKIIATLASGAEILIFDEPILGLDANHREFFYKELLKFYNDGQKTIIISTHIIEEISHILEKVVILREGKIIENNSVEDMLNLAYAVSGNNEAVDKYITSKNTIDIETLGSYKKATILQERTKEDLDNIKKLELEISTVELQKLFIYLTNMGE
ncbi:MULTISPECIES: ATP-binding cassette domain-containing protein [Clostridium]|uniref:ABC transporter ATP-binding protein n=1 Tax=Clostridium sporogenes TaxID=1509 RepID=A0A7X5PAT0_CLOSG|nr:ABC transporter ATP-binding protein [Clostridium sporogenes]AJD30698.1 ABC transporter family protein [Clostridium botulinum Prevot_594]AVP59652.1 ABC transporter ATP-binding protein [Clostridium botulinum]KQB76762.1 multidrug ABC transporter ATP-binding protein [Clostridium butyricum]AKC61941.1 ABC transporter, ATP-binding protein [Clostridium sporogenes]AKJ89242.1 multidrug ABC transporter ATP-binding protein [Clostridium sporogenes]